MSGHHGSQQPANTRYDHDNINLQRLDYQPITQKKKMPKTFNQVWEEFDFFKSHLYIPFKMMKKKSQKPSKKMDKMYKKMMEKERLRSKKEHFKKMQKKHVPWREDEKWLPINNEHFLFFIQSIFMSVNMPSSNNKVPKVLSGCFYIMSYRFYPFL